MLLPGPIRCIHADKIYRYGDFHRCLVVGIPRNGPKCNSVVTKHHFFRLHTTDGCELFDNGRTFLLVSDEFKQDDPAGRGATSLNIMQSQSGLDVDPVFSEYLLHSTRMFNSIRDMNAYNDVFVCFHDSLFTTTRRGLKINSFSQLLIPVV
jgi:hypothetical protein